MGGVESCVVLSLEEEVVAPAGSLSESLEASLSMVSLAPRFFPLAPFRSFLLLSLSSLGVSLSFSFSLSLSFSFSRSFSFSFSLSSVLSSALASSSSLELSVTLAALGLSEWVLASFDDLLFLPVGVLDSLAAAMVCTSLSLTPPSDSALLFYWLKKLCKENKKITYPIRFNLL